MSDLISRQKVLETLEVADTFLDEERTVEMYKALLTECIKVLPSAENKGEWIRMGEAYVCSRCSTTCACTETADKWIWHTDDKFCRGCGAMMDEKGGE